MPGQSIGFIELLGAVSMLSYSVFAWVFATRLLRRARKSGSLPEVSLATGYLLIAGLGYHYLKAGRVDDLSLTAHATVRR